MKQFYLNGEWDFMPVYGVEACLELPQKLVYDENKIRVPSSWCWNTMTVEDFQPFHINDYPEQWGKASTAVYHRTFILPAEAEGQKVFLHLNGVADRARVYLNGIFVVDWEETFLPLCADISEKAVRKGENDLLIVVTGFDRVTIPSGEKKLTNLGGSWMRNVVHGLWNDVFLSFEPYTYVEDITVRTFVRGMRLETLIDVVNDTDKHKNLTAKIKILDQGQSMKEFSSLPFTVTSYGKQTVLLKEHWEDPILWDIDRPYLYMMEVSLYEGENLIAQKTQRFGFREFWNEGYRFILNGKRINLRGDSWHFQGAIQMTKEYALNWFKMCHENGVNYVRLHAEPHPDFYLDAADEIGMLIVDETAIYGSGKSMAADHPLFIENCRKHIPRLVKRDKNHPAVIIWSLQNEMRWVDGRNGFKKYEVELQTIFNRMDPTRKVSLDGDNRLIDYKDSQLESLHYNIDGTLAQWKKEKPLTIGEHCGLWYICPQNASAYIGLSAYRDVDNSSIGFAAKERIFVEEARRKEVSGISTFNFANYFMRSMPDEDVILEDVPLEGAGNKLHRIPKYALTINNGLLKDYPAYRPNPTMEYMRQAFKPVTIIAQEYNTTFYDGAEVPRIFNVYNDTRDDQNCTIAYTVRLNGKPICSDKISFVQPVGERYDWKLNLPSVKVKDISVMTLTAVLFHGMEEKHTFEKEYRVYPNEWKTADLHLKKAVAFYGGDKAFAILQGLVPHAVRLSNISEISEKYPILVLGNALSENANEYQDCLKKYTEQGGFIIQLEQYVFAMGDAMLQSLPMFSAYTSVPEHPVLTDFEANDFIFWLPQVNEERPADIIKQVFVKSAKGDKTYLLESGAGDFADGGDLWSPLVEYRFGKGDVLMNQLELVENYEQVPQAYLLLRNMLRYAEEYSLALPKKVGLMVLPEQADFLQTIGLQAEKATNGLFQYSLIVADIQAMTESERNAAAEYCRNGGKLLLLPFTEAQSDAVSALTGQTITAKQAEAYHLTKTTQGGVTAGISEVDLFRYDKIPMSPRQVKNTLLATHSVEVEDGTVWLKDVPGTPWYDYYQNKYNAEYSRIALVSINRNEKQPEKSYMAEVATGKGSVILSQLCMDAANEKDIRIYSRLLGNLGGTVLGKLFSYQKSNMDYAADYMMSLPLLPHNRYETMRDYYVDPQYSLNNLGEGEYGWMLKLEKDRTDGFLTVPNSQNKTIFMSCFVDYKDEQGRASVPCKVELDTNAPTDLWFNGEKVSDYGNLQLKSGVNRVILDVKCGDENYRVKFVLTDTNGKPMQKILYHLTLDEVDPK